MCEQVLLAAAKQGQTEAFGALCEPLARKLVQSAQRITRNREDAEDALQDAFMSAFIHIKNFDGRSSFSTWLTRIAINSALMTLRKKRSSRETSIGFGESDAKGLGWDVPDPSPNPEKACAQREKEDGRLSDSGEGAAVSRETGTEESIAAKNQRARVRNHDATQTESLRT